MTTIDPSFAPPAPQEGALRRLRRKLSGDQLLRNAALLFGGATAGQALSLLAAPILSRLYTPDEFGVLAAFLAIAMLFAPLSTLRYELALPLAKAPGDADALLVLLGLLLALTVGLGLIGLGLAPQAGLALWPSAPAANTALLVLLPLAVASIGAYQAAAYEATRLGRFRPLSGSKLVQGALGPGGQIVAGLFSLGTIGLAAGFVLGQIAATAMLARALARGRPEPFRWPSLRALAAQAGRFRRFPLFTSWASLASAAGSGQLAVLLSGLLFGPAIAGFLFLAERIVARPLLMISSSILQAYMGDIAARRDDTPASLRGRFRMVAGLQFAISAVWCAAAFLLAPILTEPVFGADWSEGAAFIQALAPAYLVLFTLHPVYDTVQVLEKPAHAAVWECLRLLAIAAAFFGAVAAGLGAVEALHLYAGVQAAFCLGYLLMVDRLLGAWAKAAPAAAAR